MISHPFSQFAGTTGRHSCIRICIADVKVQMQMGMQGEWPCPDMFGKHKKEKEKLQHCGHSIMSKISYKE
jgi:hypothetical protein